MSNRTIAVLGATGNTGHVVAETLLKHGHRVIGVGRDAAKLSRLTQQGAVAAVGDLHDAAFVTDVLRQADSAYLMIPPNFIAPDFLAYGDAIGERVAQAVRQSGIHHVVHLSSQGADLPSGSGPVLTVHRQEQRLNLIPNLNVVHLRPAFFLDNLFMFVPMVQHLNMVGTAARADVKLPMIATPDIGAVAADYLNRRDFEGRTVHDLLGAANYSFPDVAAGLSRLLGRDIPYVQLTLEQQLQGLLQAGASESLAKLYVEMYDTGLNGGSFVNPLKRDSRNTTPTSLEDFLPAVAGAIRAAQPA